MEVISDEDLIKEYCVAKDPILFEEIVRRYRGSLITFVCKHVGRSHAEDIVQITFLRVHKNCERYNHTTKFVTWIFTIARNTALGYFRDSIKPLKSERAIDSAVKYVKAKEKVQTLALDVKENSERISYILEKLSPIHRNVLRLRYFEGPKSSEEIAKKLNISNAQTRLYNAKAAFKKLYIKHFGFKGII